MRSLTVNPDDLARMTPERIGSLLRAARVDRGVPVSVVAVRAGVRRRELRRWETGQGRPSAEEIIRLAAALDLEVDGLVPPRLPVAYHPGTGTLTVGDRTAAVVQRAHDADGNEAVLRTYVDAVAASRGCSTATGFPLRRDDIAVLAELLELDDVELEARLVRLVGLSAPEAATARRHLLGLRAAMLAATAGAGIVASFPIAASAAPHAQPATTLVTAESPEPILAPAAPVEIDSALVIERGTQPADPNTQIGDAVHYER